MRKTTALMVIAAMLAAMVVFALPAMAEEVVPAEPTLTSNIESFKFYDVNMNGICDPDEQSDGLTWVGGWRIELWKDGVLYDSSLTYPGGWYQFWNLPPGTYQIKEGVPCGRTCWVQTAPFDPNYYTITVTGDGYNWSCQTRFGNVCKRCVKGYTMGFWSNKNGLKLLKAYAGADGIIENIPKYGPMSVAEIQAMAQAANSVDMCVMLKAQFVAHWLSVNVGADYTGAGIVLSPASSKTTTMPWMSSGHSTARRRRVQSPKSGRTSSTA